PVVPLLLVSAASSTRGCAGWIARRLTKRQSGFASAFVGSRKRQVLPASTDLKRPTPTSPALASPVPMYITSGLSGSITIAVIERLGRKSLFALHVLPASSE